jgi:hypothetical protein
MLAAFFFTGFANGAPIYVCYTNNKVIPMQFGLSNPSGVSHTTVNPTVPVRQQGDSEGVYCISPNYFGDPATCPVDEPDTQSGFQTEIQCS